MKMKKTYFKAPPGMNYVKLRKVVISPNETEFRSWGKVSEFKIFREYFPLPGSPHFENDPKFWGEVQTFFTAYL